MEEVARTKFLILKSWEQNSGRVDIVTEISERKIQKWMEACVKTNTFPPFGHGPSLT